MANLQYHCKVLTQKLKRTNCLAKLKDLEEEKRKNWDGTESKTRPSNLPDINLNQSELTRDTYLPCSC
jgi:hypothetical protein